VLGSAVSEALEPLEEPLRLVSVAVLLAIAAVRTWQLLGVRPQGVRAPRERRSDRGGAPTYLAFLGLTLLNPVTVAYFAALIIGLQADALAGPSAKSLFVIGAFVASASWQLTLVGAGGLLHQRLPPNATLVTGLVGNAVIVLLAVRLAISG
jgi:arginine exporter protein ArgO